MNKSGFILLGLTALHLAGIFLFCRGFLLSRRALDRVTSCSPDDSTCTLKPTHSKAILLIIDSLRFDFISPSPPTPHSPHHHNVLTLPRELTRRTPDRSFIYHTYVDPPTTTLQRIKGITTGSLSTFVDMGSNFGGSEITEDSLVVQLSRARRTTAFMGDDTWMTVYPTVFARNLTFPFDSFNVEDLHTVDNGVIAHLFPLLEPGAPKWDFIIAHCLGVDHVGHRVGPDHPFMHAKLSQMDDMLRKVVNLLEDDTLLVVMGDHGMDERGDHGGDGVRETSAATWIYSKGVPLSTRNFGALPQAMVPETQFIGAKDAFRLVQQIDVLPSLALLLGLPIPFNNLGTVIPELFGSGNRLDAALDINARQIWNYLVEYRNSPSGAELDSSWEDLEAAWKSATTAETRVAFTRAALQACRTLWAQFNVVLMGMGLVLIALGVLVLLVLFVRQEEGGDSELLTATTFSLVGAASGVLLHVVSRTELVSVWHSALFAGGLGFGSTLFIFSLKGILISRVSKVSWSVVPVVLHSASLLSNSFILWEDRMSLFLLASTTAPSILVALLSPQPKLRNRILGFASVLAVASRLMANSTVCREEQAPYCTPTYYARGGSQAAPTFALLLAPIAALALPEIIRQTLAISASERGPMKYLLAYGIRLSLTAGTACWLLEYFESSIPDAPGLRVARTIISRASLLSAVAAGGVFWWFGPLCIEVRQDESKKQVSVFGFANSVGAPTLLFVVLFGVVPLWAVTQLTGHVTLLLSITTLVCLIEILDSTRDIRNPPGVAISITFAETSALALLAQLAFFATGHQATMQSIQWKAAFVLSPVVSYPWAPLSVALNAFGPLMVVGGMGSALLAAWCASATGLRNTERQATRAAIGVMLYFALVLLGAAASAAALRRHLMVWKVFAPRLMLACAALLAVDVGAVIGVGIGLGRVVSKVRVVFKSVPGVLEEKE